jgi:two-component system, NtrC family, sensor histidine kinase HydH
MVDFGSDLRKRTLILCAALALAISFSVLLKDRRKQVHILFAAFAADIALWYLAQSLYGFFQASIWARFTALLTVALPHFALRLFEAILPSPPTNPPRLPRIAGALAVPVVLLILSPYHGFGWARGIVFFYAFGLLTVGLAAFAFRGQKSPSRATQQRVRYLVFVGALSTTFSLAEFLWFIGAELPPVGCVLSIIFLFALAQSLGDERLMSLYELLGKLVVATALAFVIAFIFYLCVTVIGGFATMYLNAVLAAIVILVLFEPLRSKVEEKIHQLFFRERYDLENVVAHAQRRLVHTLEVEEMKRTVLSALENSRRMTSAALYLRESDGSSFALADSFGETPPKRLELATTRALVDRISRSGAVVLEELIQDIEERRGDPTESQSILAASSVLGPLKESVVLAIRSDDGDVLGLLIVSDDRVRDAFSPEEVALLETLAAQIGVVLENTRVYARMKIRDRLAALGQMAAGLAHEIKNPLGAIKGAAQLLADPMPNSKELDPASREFLSIIVEEVDRLDRVVRSILDFARSTNENPTAVDVNAVSTRTTQILSPAALEGCTLDLQLADDVPPAKIDPEKLRQVLMNLIQNAAEAMDGSGVIKLSTRKRTGSPPWIPSRNTPAEWVEIAVIDQGPGIAESARKNLFVPFFTTKDKGTGLGLPISQRIIQGAGGFIEVTSQAGRGTTFSIVLPAWNAEQHQDFSENAIKTPLPIGSEVLSRFA